MMTADLPAAETRPKKVIAVVGIVAILVAASFVAYLQTGSPPGTTSALPPVETSTITVTHQCLTSFTTQASAPSTGGTSSEAVDFGSLLGNFSAMTVVQHANGPNLDSSTTSSMVVLDRSSTLSGSVYEVNVTTRSVFSPARPHGSQNATETGTGAVNVTRVGSVLADFTENGRVTSVMRASGNLSVGPQPLYVFLPLLSPDISSPGGRTMSTSTLTIGTTEMSVTDMELPALVNVAVQEGCAGAPASTSTSTVSDREVQVGVVPGTDFALVTRYSYVLLSQSNSTASSGFTLTEEVTGFTVA